MSLFRSEVAVHQGRDRLPGDVLIHTPSSFYLTTAFFTVCLVFGIALALTAEYPRIESLRGVILPDKGLVTIMPSRFGTISHLYVQDGAAVAAGQLLASIKVDESTRDGTSAVDELSAAARSQQDGINQQIDAVRLTGAARIRQMHSEADGARQEIGQMKDQLVLLRDLTSSARADFDSAQAITKSGFASKKYLQTSLDALTQRELAIVTLQQSLGAKQTQLATLGNAMAQAASETAAQVASLIANRAQLAQQSVGIGLSGAYQLRAPMGGSIAHVSLKTGQQVTTQTALMTIVPDGSSLRAEFNVPTASIGFIRVGQKVRLAIDAFPYQKFGTMAGSVDKIAESAVSLAGERGEVILAYPVVVTLASQSFRTASNEVRLKPGMTLGARVVTERRTFFEWMFEPAYSVWKRD